MQEPNSNPKQGENQYASAANLNARIALHQQYSTNKLGWYPWLFSQLEGIPANAHVLELGCGQGNFWKANIERIPPGWVVTLSDLSEGMLMEAWRNLVTSPRSFKYKPADACALPFADASYDLVLANHMLYAVEDASKAISEIRRVLKPGGTLMAATNGAGHMQEILHSVSKIEPGALENPASLFFRNLPFTLENGAEQLAPVFSSIARVEYEDSIEVDQVQPVMDYILSGIDNSLVTPEAIQAATAALQAELDQNGKIRISKKSGCFLCK